MSEDILNTLTKTQKSALTHFLKALTKKSEIKDENKIINKFIDDEYYYNEVGNPHFEWVIEFLDDEEFIKEVKFLVKKYIFEFEQKEKQKPFLDAMKQKQKEYILSKQPPTEKQLKYYKRLCKKYKLEEKNSENLSKLDLKNMIGEILDNESKKQTEEFIQKF